MAAKFAPGANVSALTARLTPLLRQSGGRWTLTADGMGLERSFRFKTFTKTWDFMTAVSLQCKIKNHHPEWSNVYNTTFIRWTTHSPRGLTDKDIEMAGLCDGLARDFAEVPPTKAAESSAEDGGRELVDKVAAEGAACCVPQARESN